MPQRTTTFLVENRKTSTFTTSVVFRAIHAAGAFTNPQLPPLPCLPIPTRLIADVVRGAQHLHDMNIVHRDITPGNILVFESEELGLHCKLADFGLSRGECFPVSSGRYPTVSCWRSVDFVCP